MASWTFTPDTACRPTWPVDRRRPHGAARELLTTPGEQGWPPTIVCDPDRYEMLTGRAVPSSLWGDADYRARLLFVDPTRCATQAGAELVVVHEIAHHRWPSYGHRPLFFDRCQHLIDTAEA